MIEVRYIDGSIKTFFKLSSILDDKKINIVLICCVRSLITEIPKGIMSII